MTRNTEGCTDFGDGLLALARARKHQILRIIHEKPSTISTAWLKTLLPLHQPPIKLVVS